jgi:triosephosphate isomerase
VTSEKPEIISEVVKAMAEGVTTAPIPVLVGAGVHSAADVKKALELGAKGVLVATDVVLAEDPEVALRELASAFK